MKKFLAVLLVISMVFCFAACGGGSSNEGGSEEAGDTVYQVGMVCIGDDNAAYDRNFYMAADEAQKILADKGINIEWTKTYNHPEGDPVAVATPMVWSPQCSPLQEIILTQYSLG